MSGDLLLGICGGKDSGMGAILAWKGTISSERQREIFKEKKAERFTSGQQIPHTCGDWFNMSLPAPT
ncbi:hypothetical protein AAFF_G00103410 [Aldrovandia affinis]|uniref:Uncharacterized protein n=1 Tax=Aldrovandia affinis TaxID=143900 RepID=A0AAD7RUA9_9TELE|nr:hypothetical protein AAFF_G00103410 [Aldrovandia affinis]